MVGTFLHYILDLKHVSCTFVLRGYIVSILSFIRNSLGPKSEYLCFFIVMLEYCFGSMCFCDCQNRVIKSPFASFPKLQWWSHY